MSKISLCSGLVDLFALTQAMYVLAPRYFELWSKCLLIIFSELSYATVGIVSAERV